MWLPLYKQVNYLGYCSFSVGKVPCNQKTQDSLYLCWNDSSSMTSVVRSSVCTGTMVLSPRWPVFFPGGLCKTVHVQCYPLGFLNISSLFFFSRQGRIEPWIHYGVKDDPQLQIFLPMPPKSHVLGLQIGFLTAPKSVSIVKTATHSSADSLFRSVG